MTVEIGSDNARIAVAGAVEATDVPRLKDALARAESTGAGSVIVDLSAATSVDVLGVGALLEADTTCRRRSVRLEIVPPRGEPGRIVELLGGGGRLTLS